ncbi:MAG: hypothetical protein KKI14_00450, partial [Nanoarchaeota archaeon]|nr:hypothetical protein [Nanoarchaeota archaeon]
MNKKGLTGAVKYGVLLGVIVFAAFILVSGMNVFADTPNDYEGPMLSDISSTIPSGNQYVQSEVYNFGINATNGTADVLPGWVTISNCTFVTNMTTGTVVAENITIADETKYITFANVTDIWNITFETEQLHGAGDYVYYWSCNLTNNTWNQTSNISYSIAQNSSYKFDMHINSTTAAN